MTDSELAGTVTDERPAGHSSGEALALALAVVCGLPAIRVFLVGVGVYLHQIAQLPLLLCGSVAVAVFLAPLTAPALARRFGRRNARRLVAAGLLIARIAEQLQQHPAWDVVLAGWGVAAFLTYLALVVADGGEEIGLALQVGVTVDVALKAALKSLDPSFMAGAWPLALVAVPAFAMAFLVQRSARDAKRAALAPGWPLIGIGLWLFIQLQLTANVALHASLLGSPRGAVFTVLAANVFAIAAVTFCSRRRATYFLAALMSASMVAAVSSSSGALVTISSQLFLTAAVVLILAPMKRRSPSLPLTVGTVTFVLVVFIYYASFDLFLGRVWLAILATTVLLFVIVVALLVIRRGYRRPPRLSWWPTLAVAPLLAVTVFVAERTGGRPPDGAGFPVRVMTYNIFQGFDADGVFALERQARVIAAAGADIVGLQEVSRGWLVNGSVDTLAWLAERLQMDYAWGPTTDPMWGNAVLSRHPIRRVVEHPMPNNDEIGIDRGLLEVEIDIGGEAVRVIVTHLHAEGGGSDARLLQSEAAIAVWGGAPRTIVVGDLNAARDSPELERLAAAGLIDAADAAGYLGDRSTHHALDPVRRLDYIWLSPDLTARAMVIPTAAVSDHLAVAVTVDR